MRIGDRIICISPGDNSLTKGKIYTITNVSHGVRVTNDRGFMASYLMDRFISLEEHRQLKLNTILCLKK